MIPNGDLSNYKINALIGKGGFGSVFRAVDKRTKKIVAIKSIDMEKIPPEKVERLISEAIIMKRIDHTNIVKCYEYFATIYKGDNKLIIVMNYLDRSDLSLYIKYLSEKGIFCSQFQVINWLKQMSSAISCIHSMNIAHRDIKPSNFLLSSKALVFLADFGVSASDILPNKYYPGTAGTLVYSAPEIIQSRQYCLQSDIWSLGITIYELMTLKVPFISEGQIRNFCNGKSPITKVEGHYSKSLKKIVISMLSLQPNDRPNADYLSDLKIEFNTELSSQYVNFDPSLIVVGRTVPIYRTVEDDEQSLPSDTKRIDVKMPPKKEHHFKCISLAVILLILVVIALLVLWYYDFF